MDIKNFSWWLIIILNITGYFIFRFGMISRGNKKHEIEFLGGILLTISFALMFIFWGIKNGLILIPIFWLITTPIVEIFISKIYKKINEPYKKYHELVEKKNNQFSLFEKNSTEREFQILGEMFPKEHYPILLRWSEKNQQTLEDTVKSVAEKWHNGDIVSACQALESDLQHG